MHRTIAGRTRFVRPAHAMATILVLAALSSAACGTSPTAATTERPAWDQVDPPPGAVLHRGTTVTVSARVNDRALAGAVLVLTMAIRTPQGAVTNDYYPRQESIGPPAAVARGVPATIAMRLVEPLEAPTGLSSIPPGSRLLELRVSLVVPGKDVAGGRLIATYPVVD